MRSENNQKLEVKNDEIDATDDTNDTNYIDAVNTWSLRSFR